MNIIIHRGTHEIGGSCVEVRDNGQAILIDIGMPLTCGPVTWKKRPTIDEQRLFLPDIPGLYKGDSRPAPVQAVLISHAHQDHYGLLHFVKDEIPVYVGQASRYLIEFTRFIITSKQEPMSNVRIFSSYNDFNIGCFHVKPFLMDHSAFDAHAFLISSGDKKVFYSGDFRDHGRKKAAFDSLVKSGPQNVDALLLEGTMLSRPNEKVPSEAELEEQIISICRVTPKMVLAYCSSQNIDRLVSFYKAANKTKRKFIADIYTANVLQKISGTNPNIPHPGFSNLAVWFPFNLTKKLLKQDPKNLVYPFVKYKVKLGDMLKNQEKTILLVRPSMRNIIQGLNSLHGCSFIYSMWKGYLKEDYTKEFIDLVTRKGARYEYVHTSGHAVLETLQKLAKRLSPKMTIPIHCEKPEEYRIYFKNVINVNDKDIITV